MTKKAQIVLEKLSSVSLLKSTMKYMGRQFARTPKVPLLVGSAAAGMLMAPHKGPLSPVHHHEKTAFSPEQVGIAVGAWFKEKDKFLKLKKTGPQTSNFVKELTFRRLRRFEKDYIEPKGPKYFKRYLFTRQQMLAGPGNN